MSAFIEESDYDAIHDILYLGFVTNAKDNSYGDELFDGVVIFTDRDTYERKGLLVFDPKQMFAERETDLKSLGYYIDLKSYLN